MLRPAGFGLLIWAALLLAPQPARAQETTSFGLTGDWGGLRAKLLDAGLDFQIGYTFEGAANPSGGDRREATGAGQLSVGATADLGKLLGDPGASFQVTFTHRDGRNLTADTGIDPLQQAQEVYGRGDVWRLTQFFYDQALFDDVVDLKLGRMTVGEDFAAFSCDFENLSFCGSQPGNLAGDYWYNWPISQWGARLKIHDGPRFYLETAIYHYDPRNLDPGKGLTLELGGGRGALVPVEAAWTPALGPRKLPGAYKIGAWWGDIPGADVFLNQARQPLVLFGGAPLQRRDRYGAYVNLQQQVTGSASPGDDHGLTLFLNLTQTDPETEAADRQISLGASYLGLPGRPKDTVALAFATTHVNDRLARADALLDAEGLADVPPPRSEYVWELDYDAQAANWLSLRPNLQFIHQPGGIPGRPDALVVGIKATLAL